MSDWDKPARGTPVRSCNLPWNQIPDIPGIRTSLNEVAGFDWSYPTGTHATPIRHNVWLRNLDKFLHSFQLSRQNGTLEWFKITNMRPEFAALPEEQMIDKVAALAQLRAFMINYLLTHRVSPVLHQEKVTEAGPSVDYKRGELSRERSREAKKIVELFWGQEHSGDPLRRMIVNETGITEYNGWSDRIDDKLENLASLYKKGPERIKELFYDDSDDSYDEGDEDDSTQNNVTSGTDAAKSQCFNSPGTAHSPEEEKGKTDAQEEGNRKVSNGSLGNGYQGGSTKFTKEVPSGERARKKRGVVPAPLGQLPGKTSDELSEEIEKKISPTLESFQVDSPKRKKRE
ncbi:hypothetical protein F4677DRAFT_440091 [Hypoxylon crocopeplum]|nr:hypothetical protein F4677DRAFT_440091 [Hypoxylon crocopeplum]